MLTEGIHIYRTGIACCTDMSVLFNLFTLHRKDEVKIHQTITVMSLIDDITLLEIIADFSESSSLERYYR
jgi:hypothetical protein